MSNSPTHPYNEDYLFSWDDIPAIDSECERLLKYLSDKFDIYWAKPGDICKSNELTISISKGVNSVEITLDDVKEKATKATLKISGDDKTCDLKVKRENGNLNVYGTRKLKFLLFKGNSSESGNDGMSINRTAPYRELHLWIDFR